MSSEKRKKKQDEESFFEWIDSIQFVDEDGKVVELPFLEDDEILEDDLGATEE